MEHGVFRYQSVYVAVPKAVAEKYCQLPWEDVKRAGDLGVDGCSVTGRPPLWASGLNPKAPPDVAFLCEGQDLFIGKTVLFQQNW